MRIWNVEIIEQAFADAAIDPSRLPDALEIATAQTGSFGAVLLPVSGGGPVPNIPHTRSMARSAEVYFQDKWYERDHRYVGVSCMQQNGVVDDLDIMDIDAIRRHPYYQEFLAPLGLQWFGGIGMASGDEVWCLSIQRTPATGAFSPEQKRLLARLSNRLSSSLALARALGHANADGALDAFEMCGTAVVLLNRNGEVFRSNQSAERLLGGAIEIVGRRLTCRDPTTTAALDRALHKLVWEQKGSALGAPIHLSHGTLRPLIACPVRLSRLSSNVLADCYCAVVLVDPDKRFRPVEAQLQAFFQLTKAEAKLAASLAAGTALKTAASDLGITKETSRSQLKNVFRKTGTHRQAELVALLTPVIGPFGSGPYPD